MANVPADAVKRINEARRQAEFDLRARLEQLDGCDITPCLGVFITFAITLFDAEADEFAGTCRDSSDLAKILRTDLKTRIVESILPDQSLKSALKHQSNLSERRPIVQEIDSHVIYEEVPGGELTTADENVHAAFARHGYWERFMPPHIGLLIRSRDNARVRKELTEALERQVTYWLGHFDYRTQPPTPFVSEPGQELGTFHSGTQPGKFEKLDPFQEYARPLGENPFPQEHPSHGVFEEATWKATTRIAEYKLDFLRANCPNRQEFLKSILTFRKRWFTTVAFEATMIVGNEETARWYEQWIDEHAKWLIHDTLSQAKRRDSNADAEASPFFSAVDLKSMEQELTLELLQMVTHYKGIAARKVVEVMALRNAARAATAGNSAGEANQSQSNGNGPTKGRTILGSNIDRLRRDCGWSFDILSEKSGLDKKLILGHVNEGKPAQVRTLKTYAVTFAKALNRPVSVAELESNLPNTPETPPA